MANFSMNPLASLAGLSQSYQSYQQNQQDQQYTRQQRMQSLQSGALDNQEKQLKVQQQQKAMQDQELLHQAALAGMRQQPDTNQSTSGAPVGMAALAQNAQSSSGNALNTGVQSGSGDGGSTGIQSGTSTQGLKGPLSMDQLAQMDQARGLPIGTSYGIMQAESNGNPDATSPKGAVGPFQVLPTTAAQPGYGLKAFDPKDPNGAMDYFAAMYKKSGGDMTKALGYWNAGPAGNPNNSETQAFAPRVLKGAQEFQQQYGLHQQTQTPTPAETVKSADAVGANMPLQRVNQAVQAQQQLVQQNMKQAQYLMKQGRPDLAQPFFDNVRKLQDDAQTLASKQMTMQKDANEVVVKAATGVQDQDSYNGFLNQVAQNPAMKSVVEGLGLTGDYQSDRSKIQTVANRSLTLKDQADIDIRKQELEIKRQTEERNQQKADAPLRAQAAVQALDDKRQVAAEQKGIPFTPSPAAAGGDPVAIRQAAQLVAKNNNKVLTDLTTADKGADTISTLSTRLGALLNKPDPVTTGGITRIPGVGAAFTGIEHDRQTFQKTASAIVSAMQAEQGAQGGARSSFTAAMYKNYEQQKPSLDYDRDTNRSLVTGLWLGAQDTKARGQFLREFHQVNPGEDLQTALGMWESYEQALGNAMVIDPNNPDGSVPNMNRSPTLPDGKPNPAYQDYHDFFRKNYHG